MSNEHAPNQQEQPPKHRNEFGNEHTLQPGKEVKSDNLPIVIDMVSQIPGEGHCLLKVTKDENGNILYAVDEMYPGKDGLTPNRFGGYITKNEIEQGGLVTIGRGGDNKIRVRHRSVSKSHMALAFNPSTNTVRVNNLGRSPVNLKLLEDFLI